MKISYVSTKKLSTLIKVESAGYAIESNLVSLMKSIETYGILCPLIVTQDNKIIDGVLRWKLAKALEMKEVPVHTLKMEEDEALLLHVWLNRAKSDQIPKYVSAFLKKSSTEGMDTETIMVNLSLSTKEFNRLMEPHFLKTDLIQNHQFSPAWVPAELKFKQRNS